jgi:hypothetical protein
VREGVPEFGGELDGVRDRVGELDGVRDGDGSMQPPLTSVFSTCEPPTDQAPPPIGHVLLPCAVHTSRTSNSEVSWKLILAPASGLERQKASL